MISQVINQPASVTSMYFHHARGMKAFPRRIECEGATYTFKEGVQCLIRKGQDVVSVFTMTDGISRYQLRFEADIWTLMNISR